MATRNDVFPSKYLKASDLDGTPLTVTIVSAPLETLKNPEGKEQTKTVLYLRGTKKLLPLNVTNLGLLCRDCRRRQRRLGRAQDRAVPDEHGDERQGRRLHPHSGARAIEARDEAKAGGDKGKPKAAGAPAHDDMEDEIPF